MTSIIVRKLLLISFFLVQIGVISLIGYVLYVLYTKPEPQFFPLDDKDAIYTIAKSPIAMNNNLQITTQNNPSDKYYFVKYKGEHIWTALEAKNSFAVLVGNSKVDLKNFVGKRVQIMGKFVGSSKQCILEDCQDIFGPWVVLNIDSVTLVQ